MNGAQLFIMHGGSSELMIGPPAVGRFAEPYGNTIQWYHLECASMFGTPSEVYVFPRNVFDKSMTAIAIIDTGNGFLIAADGRVRLDDESKRTASAEEIAQENDEQQKIFPMASPHESLVYAFRGTIRDYRGYDLLTITQRQMNAISTRLFPDSHSYLKVLGGKINREINEARRDGKLEKFPQLRKMERTAAWHIASLHFCGYFENTPCLAQIDFFYYRSDAQFDVHFPPLRSSQLFGSEIVIRSMYKNYPQAIKDSRFDDFVHELNKDASLEDAKQFAQGYIEACSSALGLEVDESICKGIGGHIHIATISKEKGFNWVIEPLRKEIP
jgi:hypothetical protein